MATISIALALRCSLIRSMCDYDDCVLEFEFDFVDDVAGAAADFYARTLSRLQLCDCGYPGADDFDDAALPVTGSLGDHVLYGTGPIDSCLCDVDVGASYADPEVNVHVHFCSWRREGDQISQGSDVSDVGLHRYHSTSGESFDLYSGGVTCPLGPSHPLHRGVVQDYRAHSWSMSLLEIWSALMPSLNSFVTTMHVVCALLSLAQLWWELRSLHECAPISGHILSPEVGADAGYKRKFGQLCLEVHGAHKKLKLDQLHAEDVVEGWIHDLTSDGDIESNPGPPMADYLAWATGGQADPSWAADGASSFIAVAHWLADCVNNGAAVADLLHSLCSSCSENTHIRVRFSFLWHATPLHMCLMDAVAFFRWVLDTLRHISAVSAEHGQWTTPSDHVLIPTAPVRLSELLQDLVKPVSAIM
eukprot:6458752-Amphidinium_carterae.1